jgi:GxxExxY protein
MIRRPGGLAEEALTYSIIGAFRDAYNELGEGWLESVYANALERELTARGHRVAREVGVRVYYKGEPIGWQRLDMIIDGKVVVEIKAGEVLPPRASRQLLNYLRATRLEVGLLLHFGAKPKHSREFCSNERLRLPQAPSDVSA